MSAVQSSFDASCFARTEYGPARPYSASWFEAWLELLSASATEAIRMRRKVAREYQTGRQRIRVYAVDPRTLDHDGVFRDGTVDSVDAFGWRAALAAARVFREDYGAKNVRTCDARIEDLIDENY